MNLPQTYSEATSGSPARTQAGELLGSSSLGFDLREEAWLDMLRGYRGESEPGRIGPYELLEEIGRGGQGVVYKARQPRTGRLIAIKRISAGAFATPQMRSRFEREIEAAAALDHPGIVTVYGSEVVDGQPLLTMQCIEGVPFDRWAAGADGSPRGIREILQVFKDACDAVHHAHQRGVIHRDLKPSNILVDSQSCPHVLDFGLAQLRADALAPDSSDARSLTLTGEFVGTLAYAAPEQLGEDRRAVDVRTDVYALGAVLYRALTGRPPFSVGGDMARLLTSIRSDAPPRPSILRDDVSRELELIVLKALAKDREQRYAGVGAMAEDVERLLSGQPVEAHPPSAWYLARKTVARHRLLSGSLAVIFLLSLTFGIVSTGLMGQLRQERNSAVLGQQRESKLLRTETELRQLADERLTEATQARQTADDEARRARRILEFMQDFFGTAEYEGGEEPGLTVKEMLDRAALRLDRGMAAKDPRIEAELRYSLGAAYRRLDLSSQAVTQFELALLLQEEVLGPDHLDVAETLSALAMARFSQTGDAAAALTCCQRALDIQRRCSDGESLRLARALQRKALLLRELGRFDEAEGLARDALAMCGRLVPPEDPAVANAWRCLGWVLRGRGDTGSLEGAAEAFRQALAIQQNRQGEDSLATADLQFQLGRDLRDLTRICEAVPLLVQALETRRKWFDPDHPFVQHVSETLGNIRFHQGRFDEAAQLWQDIQTAQRKRGDAVAPDAARRLALIQIYAGRFDEASRTLEESLAPALESWGEDDLIVADLRLCAGFALSLNEQTSAAEPLFAAAMTTLQRQLDQGGKVDVAYVMEQQAFACVVHRDADAAGRLLETPTARQALEGPNTKHRARWQTTQGFLFTRRGDYEAAESSLQAPLGYFYPSRTTHWWYHVLLSELVELYERWGRPDQAELWRERMRRPGGDQYRCP